MRYFGGKGIFMLFMLCVIVFSVALFLLSYRFDNKYTRPGPQPENGLLMLDDETINDHPLVFLIQGWEFFRGRLLSPEDFMVYQQPDEHVYIGQYGGFEGGNPERSPHGSATYRLNILIPEDPATYTLELPEIFSAYILYINGVKAEQFGNPDPVSYHPQTGISSVSFLARERVEIILAVSDFSHMYSGMVHPPAFGNS